MDPFSQGLCMVVFLRLCLKFPYSSEIWTGLFRNRKYTSTVYNLPSSPANFVPSQESSKLPKGRERKITM